MDCRVGTTRTGITRAVGGGKSIVVLRSWTQEEFEASNEAWSDLLSRSDADPLFMSWHWQWLWWKHHAGLLQAQLLLIAGYDGSGRLVGLAPFYLHRGSHRGMSAGRLESIGSSFRLRNDVFSEYLDLIVDRDYVDSFLPLLAEMLLAESRWSDLVFSNTPVDGLAARLVREYLGEGRYVREVDQLTSFVGVLPRDFSQYIQSLDGNTRRRMWNQRKKLKDPCLRKTEHFDGVLKQLDSFHVPRWGCRHYVGVRGEFHRQFAAAMAATGALHMTELSCDGQLVSVMYNVRIGHTEYNIQSGFDSLALKGLSLGYLHFGYAMERACEEGMAQFDFLAGPGMHRDYKRDFQAVHRPLTTFQTIRAKPLAWLYRGYDRNFITSVGFIAPSAGALVDCALSVDVVSNLSSIW